MRTVILSLLTIAVTTVTAQANRTLPDYLPNAPSASKVVSDYTVADVMGCICNSEKTLPEGHPFKINDGEKLLKEKWPGAKVSTNIDAFVAYLLATPDALESTREGREEWYISENLYWVLEKVMDVSHADKSAALARVYAKENDSVKRRKLVKFCGKVLPAYCDIRLLTIMKNALDDDGVINKLRAEEAPTINITMRSESVRICYQFIVHSKFLGIAITRSDFDSVFVHASSEQEKCMILKKWMNTNGQAIERKTNELQNQPNRKYAAPVCLKFSVSDNE